MPHGSVDVLVCHRDGDARARAAHPTWIGRDALERVGPVGDTRRVPLREPAVEGGLPVAMTWWLSVPPLISKVTLLTPAEAAAPTSAAVPDWVAPFDGMVTAVVGGGVFTVMVMPGLVPLTPPG